MQNDSFKLDFSSRLHHKNIALLSVQYLYGKDSKLVQQNQCKSWFQILIKNNV